jgi:ribosomal protein L7/L12
VGIFVFFVSVPTNPARWWRYVRTGTRLPTQPAAEFTDPGVFVVELQDSGSRSIALIKALREVTTVELAGALSKVTNVPATIADGLSEESARRVRDRVERAGATASIVPRDGV